MAFVPPGEMSGPWGEHTSTHAATLLLGDLGLLLGRLLPHAGRERVPDGSVVGDTLLASPRGHPHTKGPSLLQLEVSEVPGQGSGEEMKAIPSPRGRADLERCRP